MRKYGMNKIVFAGAAIAMAWGGTVQAEVNVAVVGPITGQYATFGEQMKRGVEKAVEDINKAGGVLGKKLVLAIGDDRL